MNAITSALRRVNSKNEVTPELLKTYLSGIASERLSSLVRELANLPGLVVDHMATEGFNEEGNAGVEIHFFGTAGLDNQNLDLKTLGEIHGLCKNHGASIPEFEFELICGEDGDFVILLLCTADSK